MTTSQERDSLLANAISSQYVDSNPEETREWRESLDALIAVHGEHRARQILLSLLKHSANNNIGMPNITATDYINTIAPDEQPAFPGNEEYER
ncbi:MAG: hypothetical protein NTW81_06895, partial [Actinobacteria bacterium]|nr:hypothetical protein [Actinomycetota bacterium]